MVTRFIEQTLCNVCLKKDEKEQLATYSEDIVVGSSALRRMELCDEHKIEFLQMLIFIQTYGDTLIEEPERRAGFGCNLCAGVFPTRAAKTRHVRQDHRGLHQLKAAEKIAADA